MDEAAIFTIHSFCQKMLTLHAFESGVLYEQTFINDEFEWRKMAVEDYWRQHIASLPLPLLELVLNLWRSPEILQKKINSLLHREWQVESPVSMAEVVEAFTDYQQHVQAIKCWWLESGIASVLQEADLKKSYSIGKSTTYETMLQFCQSDAIAPPFKDKGWSLFFPESIEKARKNSLVDAEKANRGIAALSTADAYAASVSGDTGLALKEAEAGVKLAAGFTPAVMLAAKLHHENGKRGKAVKLIETAFAKEAHPALIRLFDKLYADQSSEKRAEMLRKLADKNPETREAVLLRARAHNLTENWTETITTLEPLMTGAPSAAEYALMAAAATGIHGAEIGQGWLERAATAPRDPRPGADGEFQLTREGWARLVHEYMEHGRLAPPPLEEAGIGVSAEEIRLLTTMPAAEEAEVSADDQVVGDVSTDDAPADVANIDVTKDDAPTTGESDQIKSDDDAARVAAAAREIS